jgi:hypothetical protein
MTDTPSSAEMQGISETLLSALRSAALRAELDANEVKTIAIALRAGWITPEYVVQWLADIGLVDQVIVDEVRP